MAAVTLSRSRGVVFLAAVAALALTLTACSSSGGSTPKSPTSGPTQQFVDHSGALVVPRALHVDGGLGQDQARLIVRVAQTLYTFWNTGKKDYLLHADAPSFRDNTLPAGRKQGRDGALAASAGFRAALPDLTCELADLYVTGDTFTARLVFRGHFTGRYDGVPGCGQAISFNAIDIQHVGNGTTITEDWHIEDNLSFLTQAALVQITGGSSGPANGH